MKFTQMLLWALPLLCATAMPAHAQNAGQAVLEEVIVTAERRSASVQETPLTITAVTSETMAQQGIVDARSLMDAVPGFDMNYGNPNTFIGLYGLQSGSTMWSDGVMTYNYGGVPLSRQTSAASSMYDVERVEVLKGPQGTLYGRNATVGALNVVLARPGNDYGGKVSLNVGNYNAINTQGAVNLPINDQWKTRFAFQSTRHDGYFTNGYDDANNFGARASVLFEPNDNSSLLLWADVFRNRAKGSMSTWRYYLSPTQEWIDPNNPWFGIGAPGSCTNQLLCPTFASNTVGGVNTQTPVSGFGDTGPNGLGNYPVQGTDGKSYADQDIFSAEYNTNVGFGDLTVIGARVNTNIDYKSYSNGLLFYNNTDAYQNSLEVRLASSGKSRLQWVAGGFYFHEHQDALQNNLQSTGWAVLYTPNLTDTNYALFADTTFDFTDHWRLLAGARYTKETKSQDGYVTANGLSNASGAQPWTDLVNAGATCYTASIASKVYFAGNYYPANFCVIPNSGDYNDSNVSWKLGTEYHFNDDSMLYATARTGFRAGGFVAGTDNTYDPEKLTAYEVGSKNLFFNRRLQANLSAFYWKYDGQQIAILRTFYYNGANAGQTSYPLSIDGDLKGAELDLQAALTTQDNVQLSALYVEGKFDKTPPIASSAGGTAALSDIPRFNLPKWQITAGYQHSFELGTAGNLEAGVDAHYESKTILRLVDPVLAVPGEKRDAYTKWNASLTWHPQDDKWSLQGYVRNITNEAIVGVGASGQSTAPVWYKPSSSTMARSASLEPPRTYGVQLSTKF
jgi:iron complex outermembrane recepter protein